MMPGLVVPRGRDGSDAVQVRLPATIGSEQSRAWSSAVSVVVSTWSGKLLSLLSFAVVSMSASSVVTEGGGRKRGSAGQETTKYQNWPRRVAAAACEWVLHT